MVSRTIFILCIVVFISCKKDGNNGNNGHQVGKSYNITITGVISDQVTGQPVSGATVSCGVQPLAVPGDSLISAKETTLSGTDGTYKLITESPSTESSVLPGVPEVIAIVASKPGFVSCNRAETSYFNAQNTTINIQLYHSAQLNLHIKHDTINNSIDGVIFVGFFGFRTVCTGRELDTIYEIKNLWGNMIFVIREYHLNGLPLTPEVVCAITPKPDTINYFDITF